MKKSYLIILSALSLSGCITPIGQENFTCEAEKKGGVCAGPREIYELTNTRENLEQLDKTIDVESSSITVIKKEPTSAPPTVYQPRSLKQQTPESYDKARPIEVIGSKKQPSNPFSQWPSNAEPIAPEPLAVLKPPKVMRILIAAWKDSSGNLNMPGFVYVDVEPKTWSYGEAANLRPTRVVPLEVRKESQEQIRQREHQKKGVSPLEIITGQ